ANANPGPDTIRLYYGGPGSVGTITLGADLPSITGDLTIVGVARVTISGADKFRVLQISPNVTVNLDKVILTQGFADFGGGIFNQGNLTITNSTLSANRATVAGGAIANVQGGTVTITNSTLSGNMAGSGGGGAIANDVGTVTITDSVISNNQAVNSMGTARGGGILTSSGSVKLDRVTLENNTARGADGGAGADGLAAGGGANDFQGGELTNRGSSIPDHPAPGGARGHGLCGGGRARRSRRALRAAT